MYKFLTDDQNKKCISSIDKNSGILDKKNEKLNSYKDKEYKKLEKSYLKSKLKYDIKLENIKKKLESKKSLYLNDSNNNYNSDFISKLDEIYSNKINNINEDMELLFENYKLAKKDIDDGIEYSINYNEKIYIRSVYKKYAKINFKKQFKIKKNDILKKDISPKEKRKEFFNLKINIYENSNKEYKPISISYKEYLENRKEKFELWKLKKQKQLLEMKNYSFKDWITIKIWIIPLYLLLLIVGVVVAAILTGIVTSKMIYAIAILLTLSIVFGVIFTKIPIWNKYFGGALIGCMIVGSLFVEFNILPKEVQDSVNTWFKSQDYLGMYISVLLVGAVLLIPRKMIIKAIGGFFAIILIGTLGATGLGLIGMLVTGLSMQDFLLNYWLPILCDGNGGGIQPIGEIAAQNGFNQESWISQAVAVSTVASILSVVMAGVVSWIGKVKPSLSGDGKLVKKDIHTTERKSEAKDRNVAVAVLVIAIIYILSDIIAEKLITKELIGILIPNYAWMIVIGIIINLVNLIPGDIKKGISKVNTFISKQTTWLLMFAVGMVYINFQDFINALNPTTFLMCIAFVVGAAILPLFFAKLFKFYGVESSVSAGLCMTAQGGTGAIMVLGTSNRMGLMPWGQITCRIAGSLILIFAGIFFSIYAKEPVIMGLL